MAFSPFYPKKFEKLRFLGKCPHTTEKLQNVHRSETPLRRLCAPLYGHFVLPMILYPRTAKTAHTGTHGRTRARTGAQVRTDGRGWFSYGGHLSTI